MTRQQLEAVIECLVEIAESWNEGDRYENNNALCLTLYEDGSGRLGRRGEFATVLDLHTFNSFEGLCRVLEDGEGVKFEDKE
jgi:hypothetical protein